MGKGGKIIPNWNIEGRERLPLPGEIDEQDGLTIGEVIEAENLLEAAGNEPDGLIAVLSDDAAEAERQKRVLNYYLRDEINNPKDAEWLHLELYFDNGDQGWAYRAFLDALYSNPGLSLNNKRDRSDIASTMEYKAETELGMDSRDININSDFRGYRKIIESMSPPLVNEKTGFVERRLWSPTDVSAKAIKALVRSELGDEFNSDSDDFQQARNIDFNVNQRRQQLAEALFLDPNAIDRIFDDVMSDKGSGIIPGTSAGTYGRFFRVNDWSDFDDEITGYSLSDGESRHGPYLFGREADEKEAELVELGARPERERVPVRRLAGQRVAFEGAQEEEQYAVNNLRRRFDGGFEGETMRLGRTYQVRRTPIDPRWTVQKRLSQ